MLLIFSSFDRMIQISGAKIVCCSVFYKLCCYKNNIVIQITVNL